MTTRAFLCPLPPPGAAFYARTYIQVVWFLSVSPLLCDCSRVLKNTEDPVEMETHDSFPRAEVGAFVQQCIKDGAVIVVVTQNPDQRTCRVIVQRD